MPETNGNGERFTGYDYKEVTAAREMEGVYADGYPNFGWVLDSVSNAAAGLSTVLLKFKRDRKVRNKAELTRLQRQFDSGVAAIARLERSKLTAAMITAFTVGIIGTAFLAGSVFAFVFAEMVVAMIVLAVPGLVGWFLPYFLYKRIAANKTAAVAPLIDKQYDDVYEICEKAHALLG